MRRTLILLSLLLTAVLLAGTVRALLVTQYVVTATDAPDLLPGDRVLVNRVAYGLRLPGDRWWGLRRLGNGRAEEGDYIAFYDPQGYGPEDRRPVRVGQVLAAPGDTLWLDPARRSLLTARTTTDARPVPIPAAGTLVDVTPWTARLLWRTLRQHEHRPAVLVGDTALRLGGRLLRRVRVRQDYYWTEGSAQAGLVPASSLVGRAFCVSYSLDPAQPFGRRWRSDRCLSLLP